MVKYVFAGKTVLVTGASRGMGAAILEAFAVAGATCLLNHYPDDANRRDADRTAERLRSHQVPVHLFDADVSRYESVEAMMQRVRAELGRTLGVWAAPVFHHIVRWDRAIPQYHLGHLERVARMVQDTGVSFGYCLGCWCDPRPAAAHSAINYVAKRHQRADTQSFNIPLKNGETLHGAVIALQVSQRL